MKILEFHPSKSHTLKGSSDTIKTMFKNVSGKNDLLSLTIRELVQNSLDNKKNEKVKINIRLEKINYDFVDFSSLETCIKDCLETEKKESERNRLFKLKSKIAGASEFYTLTIEDDSGGLSGSSRIDYKGDTPGLESILAENFSTKDASNLGSFGVGKITALLASDIHTVYYVNSVSGINKIIGKTLLSGYRSRNSLDYSGPEIYCGEPKANNNTIQVDWSDCDIATFESVRKIKGDGLSTLIPVGEKIFDFPISWENRAVFSCINSYFQKIEEDMLEIIIEDVDKNVKIFINKSSYRRLYNELEDVFEGDDLEFDIKKMKFNYLLLRPVILGEDPVKKIKEELKFNLIKQNNSVDKFNGYAEITFYKNEKLEKLIDDERLTNEFRYNFRIIRNGMLIRNFQLPNYKNNKSLHSYKYSGIVEFKTIMGMLSIADKVISPMETQSHDNLAFEEIDELYIENASKKVEKYVISPLTKVITSTIKDLTIIDDRNLDSIEINIDVEGKTIEGVGVKNLYYRNLIDLIDGKKKTEPKSSATQKSPGTNEEISYNKGIEVSGGGEEIVFPDNIGLGKKRKSKLGSRPGDKPVEDGTKNNEGHNQIKEKSNYNQVEIRSKRISRTDSFSKYVIQCRGDFNGDSKIHLYQNSIDNKRAILSFNPIEIKCNDRVYDRKEWKLDSRHIEITKIPSGVETLNFEITLIEPSNSSVDFFVKII